MSLESVEKLRRWLVDELNENADEEWFSATERNVNLDAMLDAIERDVEERYVALPLDANGKTIRVGDSLEDEYGSQLRCEGIMLHHGAWQVVSDRASDDGGFVMRQADRCRNVKRPTVEDVLREYHKKRNENGVAHIRGELRQRSVDELTAEYADKVREAVRAE